MNRAELNIKNAPRRCLEESRRRAKAKEVLPRPFEWQDQIALVWWLRTTYPEIARWVHHSPNGGYIGKRAGEKNKAMGTSPGYPDLVVEVPSGKFCGLALELKRVSGGSPTLEQMSWLHQKARQGYQARWAAGFDSAKLVIEEYLRELRSEAP